MSAKKRVAWAAIGIVAAAGIAFCIIAANGFGFSPSSSEAETKPPATDEVTRGNLVSKVDKNGELSYADSTRLAAHGGTVTWLPAEGSVIERNGVLWRVDEKPTVLFYGAVPSYRTLSPGDEGADVAQLEQNLAALGYDGFDVDDVYTEATAKAVRAWQKSLGVERTGDVDPGQIVYQASAIQVTAVSSSVGAAAGDILTAASPSRTVSLDLKPTETRYTTLGAPVRLTLPNGTATTGKVSSVKSIVKEAAAGGPDTASSTILRVTVTPDDASALPRTGAATVTASFVADSRENVLSVPVSSLLALSEGGYGVELFQGGKSRITRVETGLFADGRVEVTGDGIAEHSKVVVPG